MSDHRKMRPPGEGRKHRRCDSAAPSPTHFFRIMLPSFIQEKKLRIPKRFIKRFGAELSANANLAVPNGSDWNVKLDKVDKEVYFTDGWHQFAQHHSIKEYYFLVFKYRGSSSFDVAVFDLSTTEICYDQEHVHGKQCPSHHEDGLEDIDDDDDDSIEIFGSSPSLCLERKLEKKKLTLGGSSNPPAQKNLGITTCLRVKKHGRNSASLKNQGFKRKYMLRTRRSKMDNLNESSRGNLKTKMGLEKLNKSKPKSEPNENEDEQPVQNSKEGKPFGMTTLSRGSSMKKTEMNQKREEAIKAASMYKPKNTSFMAIMRSYNVRKGYVHVAADFSRKLPMQVSEFIKLRNLDGREWCVRCIPSDRKGWKISMGWLAFAQENDLKEGDVCVFEVMQGAEIVLKVTIFRTNEDGGS